MRPDPPIKETVGRSGIGWSRVVGGRVSFYAMPDTDDDHSLSPDVREQLLATLEEMAEVLRSIDGLAERRGYGEAWWELVRRMLVLRIRLQRGPLGEGFPDEMEDLCLAYDGFVETVLPGREDH